MKKEEKRSGSHFTMLWINQIERSQKTKKCLRLPLVPLAVL
jgi:hypothetical protein